MSFLYLKAPALGTTWKLSCTSFSTTLISEMSSVQVRMMQHHYPVKAQQPAVEFQVVFGSEPEFEQFQQFIRSHHLSGLGDWTRRPEVTLWWPEREITNWTGFITQFAAGGARRNPAPHAKISVDLVDSMFYHRTDIASVAASWLAVAGYGSLAGMLELPSVLGEAAMDFLNLADELWTSVT